LPAGQADFHLVADACPVSDYAQDGKAYLTGVVIVSKEKPVVGVEPAVVEMSAILGPCAD
jgi:hypothetical protein